MDVQTEPLDLSTKNDRPNKMYNIIDLKFLAGLNSHLVELYERTTLVCEKESYGMPQRMANMKNILPCQVCLKAFDRPSLLKRHMRTHTGEKPHICNVCNKGFSTSSSLNTHRRIHTGEKPHKCPECGKCFTASSNLYYHRMTHTKNKPHKCSWCARSFPTPGELRAHAASHGGAHTHAHACAVCRRAFAKPAALRHHVITHHGPLGSIHTKVVRLRSLKTLLKHSSKFSKVQFTFALKRSHKYAGAMNQPKNVELPDNRKFPYIAEILAFSEKTLCDALQMHCIH